MLKDSIFYGGIIIDTNAFDAKGNDFYGYFDAILPSFLLQSKHITFSYYLILFCKEKYSAILIQET